MAPHELRPIDWLVVAAINLVWGFNIIAVKLSVELVPPFTAALLRQAIVLLVCLPWLKIVRGRMRLIVALGLVLGGGFFALVNLSISVSDHVGALAIASQLSAPFALILAVLFLKERIGLPRIASMTLAVAGCALLVFDPAIADEIPGLLLTAAASLCWAIGSLLQRQLVGVSVPTMYGWIGLGGIVVLGPLALALEPAAVRGVTTIPPIAFAWIATSALGSTLVGSGGMAWLLQRHPVSTVVPLSLGTPVIAVIAAALVFGNAITPVMIVGGAIALAGVVVVTTRTAARQEGRT